MSERVDPSNEAYVARIETLAAALRGANPENANCARLRIVAKLRWPVPVPPFDSYLVELSLDAGELGQIAQAYAYGKHIAGFVSIVYGYPAAYHDTQGLFDEQVLAGHSSVMDVRTSNARRLDATTLEEFALKRMPDVLGAGHIVVKENGIGFDNVSRARLGSPERVCIDEITWPEIVTSRSVREMIKAWHDKTPPPDFPHAKEDG